MCDIAAKVGSAAFRSKRESATARGHIDALYALIDHKAMAALNARAVHELQNVN